VAIANGTDVREIHDEISVRKARTGQIETQLNGSAALDGFSIKDAFAESWSRCSTTGAPRCGRAPPPPLRCSGRSCPCA
jgi:hypothetical protein